MAAVYATIWLSLLLFVVGESGRSFVRSNDPPRWAWPAFATGLVLAIVHVLLALWLVHGWSHASAVRETEVQTAAIYGWAFGGSLYVNYLFLAAWLVDAWWWRAAPTGYVRPAAVTWSLRSFYFLIIFNGAVVFAPGARRVIGLVLVGWLLGVWIRNAGMLPAAHGLSRARTGRGDS